MQNLFGGWLGDHVFVKANNSFGRFLQIEGVCILKFAIFEIRNNFRKNHRSSTKEDRYKIIKTCGRPGNGQPEHAHADGAVTYPVGIAS